MRLSASRTARLQRLAERTGRDPSDLLGEAVDRLLEYEERFAAAVEKGRSSSRRGELLEHNKVVERIEQMFRS
jgi:predicted transcriptional regulator